MREKKPDDEQTDHGSAATSGWPAMDSVSLGLVRHEWRSLLTARVSRDEAG
jgi:hypothetical protein